jgi:hypothetical protein
MRPITHPNPYESPQTPPGVAPEPRVGSGIPVVSRGAFGWLFAAFLVIQFLPGYHDENFLGTGKPRTHYVLGLNCWAVLISIAQFENFSTQNFTLVHTLQALALGAYLLLNIRMLPQRLTISGPTLLILIIMTNMTWYYLTYQNPNLVPGWEYPRVGLYLQTIFMSATSFVAGYRWLAEKQFRSNMA